MKLYLSSLSVMVLAAFASSAPVFCADTPASPTAVQAPQVSTAFSADERYMAKQDPKYFTIDPASVQLVLKETKTEPDMSYVRMNEPAPKDLTGVLGSIDQIVNVATKIWDIIQANAPVVGIDTKYATAYPQGITAATQLAQWSKPKSQVYGFSAKNLYGSTMIDCEYKVTYTYNGAYQGKGKFLTAVTVIPTNVTVGWGYKFYLSAAVPDSTITNVGTDADPIAAMQLKLNWKMSTVLKEEDGASVYYVQGDGAFEEIANPWKAQSKIEDVKAAGPLLNAANVF
jgi:hypothetical protein